MRITSVRVRMTLWSVGMLALMLTFFLVAVHVTVRTYMLSTIDQRLQRQTDGYLVMMERIQAGNPEVKRRFLRNPPPPPREERRGNRPIRAFNLQGEMIDLMGKVEPEQEAPWNRAALQRANAGHKVLLTRTIDGVPMRVFSRPLYRHGVRIGAVQTAYPLTEMSILQEGLTRVVLVLVPLALLAAGLGGMIMTRRMLRPVEGIAHTAATISAEDLSRRLPVTGDDEFAHLATTFNGMLSRVQEAFTRLEQSIEQERRFTADASHELRTPLTAIKANTSLALRSERTPQQYREALQAADRAADVMNRLVQDLLLLARSDSGQLVITPQAIVPETLFGETLAMVTTHADHAPVRVEINDPSLAISGDMHHLTRLLVNLLENALRHTPATGEVVLAASRKGNEAVLTVADTGEGIAPEHIAHLTERFYRVDAARARKHGGTGLGLAICRSIVDAHHGQLHIDSTPGHGTTVTVRLPMPAGA